jgi:putative spermidine/putrescine transport system ATP-binding protein
MTNLHPEATTDSALVELRNLTRLYGQTRALDGLTLTLHPGELLALLGPSGCGKTTALRVLAGFESLNNGEVLVDGKDVQHVPAQRRDMGMVFQSYSLFPNMTAADNVGYGLRMRKVGKAERRRKAADMLELVGLGDRMEQYPHQLSGGQQQRVALARALAFEPRVLLLDEPLSALDAKVRLELRGQIRAIQQRLGITTLFVTHDQEEALSMADRVCVMRDGRIEQVATPAEMYTRPATAFVAEFVGTMNRLPARIDGSEVVVLGRRAGVRNLEGRQSGTSVDVMVRPEELRIEVNTGGSGFVTSKTFLGSITRVGIILDEDTSVQVDLSSETAAKIGTGDVVEVLLAVEEVMIGESLGTPSSGSSIAASIED